MLVVRMKQLLFALFRFVVVFLASSLVFFALVVFAARILTPFLTHKPQAIEHFMANLLHKPVQIKQFSQTWRGLSPFFQAEDVTIWNDAHTQPLLHIKQLEVSINILKTLITDSIQLDTVRVLGSELVIQETGDNQFTINGFDTAQIKSEKDQSNPINPLLAWLIKTRISLQDIKLNYYPHSGEKWPEMQLRAASENKYDHHYLSANLKSLGAYPENLTLIADITGTIKSPLDNIKGQLYLEGHSILLDRWINLLTKKYAVKKGIGSFKLWSNWQQSRCTKIQTLFALAHTTVVEINKKPPLVLMPFTANVEWESSANTNWAVNANVNNLGFLAWGKIPGVRGLNGHAHITPTSGNFIANSSNLDLDFKKLFKAPIHLDNLYSELDWQHTPDTTLIKITKFSAVNADAIANARVGLWFAKENKFPQISLLAQVKTKRPSQVSAYLPQPFIGHKLVEWLDKAIVNGQAQGKVILQGPLATFPFDKNEGTFLIDTKIDNGELHYQAKWPNVKKINGELIFSGRQMQMVVDSAEIFGVAVQNIVANIPVIKTHVQAVLHVAANNINTQLKKGLNFLRATPIAKDLVGLSSVALTGPLKLALQLTIPLELGTEKLKIAGIGIIQSATAYVSSLNLSIDNLKGQFSLSNKGVDGKNLNGLLLNKPINIGIQSTPKTQLAVNYEGIDALLSFEEKGWHVSVNNKIATGEIFFPSNKEEAIEANFDTIRVNAESSMHPDWSFKHFPSINLHAKNVYYKKINFGKVQLKLRPVLSGIVIEGLEAQNSSYRLMANGVWHKKENQSTAFSGQLDSGDLNNFLHNWGLPASIIAKQAHMRFDLQWPSAPYDLNLSKLNGNIFFSAENGQLVDIGSSVEAKLGFARLLTFLSLQSLGRRLQLDFSDLQTKAFDFTSVQGQFNLKAGNAITPELIIEGPTAKITVLGRVGLQMKDYDLKIKVLPHFTSSLPVIVALTGGPIPGAIAWFAEEVFGSTVQKIAETSYSVTGSWTNPHIQKNT